MNFDPPKFSFNLCKTFSWIQIVKSWQCPLISMDNFGFLRGRGARVSDWLSVVCFFYLVTDIVSSTKPCPRWSPSRTSSSTSLFCRSKDSADTAVEVFPQCLLLVFWITTPHQKTVLLLFSVRVCFTPFFWSYTWPCSHHAVFIRPHKLVTHLDFTINAS